jgi:hypothetical protein
VQRAQDTPREPARRGRVGGRERAAEVEHLDVGEGRLPGGEAGERVGAPGRERGDPLRRKGLCAGLAQREGEVGARSAVKEGGFEAGRGVVALATRELAQPEPRPRVGVVAGPAHALALHRAEGVDVVNDRRGDRRGGRGGRGRDGGRGGRGAGGARDAARGARGRG